MSELKLNDIVKAVADSQNLVDYSIADGDNKDMGLHYFGALSAVTISGIKRGQNVTIHFLMKCPPKNELLRTLGPVTMMFEREIFVYTKLLPRYERLQENLSEKYLWPECFYYHDRVPQELLVLQDLRHEGFGLSSGMFFDLQHTLVAVRTLAKFHALSFALEKSDPKVFEVYGKACWSPFDENLQGAEFYMNLVRENLLKTAEILGGELAGILRGISVDAAERLRKATSQAEVKVIGHGDVWKNNILFKYKNGQPCSACLIDYQTAQMQSPAQDLLYLVCASTDRALRQSSFQNILRTYHAALSDFLAHFAVDTAVYSLERLQQDLKLAAPACVILANSAFRQWCGLEKELSHFFDDGVKANDLEAATALHSRIIKDIVTDFKDFGYL